MAASGSCPPRWLRIGPDAMRAGTQGERPTARLTARAPGRSPGRHRVSMFGDRKEIGTMPEKETVERAKKDKRQGKSPSTQAGEFVREEMEHIREGKHGARSTKQAIAIGLSKARRSGVPLKPPAKGKAPARTRKSAEQAYETGQGERKPRAPSRTRGRAVKTALKREGRSAASKQALSRQARQAAQKRSPAERR